MPTPYNPKAVANYFIRKWRDDGITQMKLHKLLYYAQGWCLAFKGEPLLDEMVEAWEYGPVVPSVYQEFKEFGAKPIKRQAEEFDPGSQDFYRPQIDSNDEFTARLLDRIWEVYGIKSASDLSRMTHSSGSPWTAARDASPGIRGVNIDNSAIEHYFKERIEVPANA